MEFHYFDYDTDEVKKDSLCVSRQSLMDAIVEFEEYIYTTCNIDLYWLGLIKQNGYKVFIHYAKDDVIEL